MKKLSAAAAAALTLAMSAGSALAADYQGTAVRAGGAWRVQWSGVTPNCDLAGLFAAANRPTTAIVDGAEVSLTPSLSSASGQTYSVVYQAGPDGNLTSIKIDGKTSLPCDMHTFLLPGYVAPAPVPTLSEWAMIAMGLMLAAGAALFIHRRRLTAHDS